MKRAVYLTIFTAVVLVIGVQMGIHHGKELAKQHTESP